MAMSRKQIMYLYATGVFKRLPAGMKAKPGEVDSAKKKSKNQKLSVKELPQESEQDSYSVNKKKGYSTSTPRIEPKMDGRGLNTEERITPEFRREVKKIEKLPTELVDGVRKAMNRTQPGTHSGMEAVAALRHKYDQLPKKKRDGYDGGFKQFAEEFSRTPRAKPGEGVSKYGRQTYSKRPKPIR